MAGPRKALPHAILVPVATSKRRRAPVAKPIAATQGDLTNPLAIVDTRSGSKWGPTLRYNPDDIAGPKGLRIFDKMLRDEQVFACYALKVAAIIGPGWMLEAADETPAAQALAEQLTADLTSLPGPLEDALEGVLTAIGYGFSLTEQIYAPDGDRIRLSRLQWIAPHDVRFEQDPFGTIISIRQQMAGLDPLPPGKFMHFVNQAGRNFANPYGTSDLTAAYQPWFSKVHWAQWMNVFGEKLADAPIISKHPKDSAQAKIAQAQNVLENLQARTVLSVPTDWEVSLLESGGRSPRNTFIDSIEHLDHRIGKALLIPDKFGLTGGEVQAGSLALSQTQMGVFGLVISLMAKRLEACVQQQLIMRMAALADGKSTPQDGKPGYVPNFKLMPMGQEDRKVIVDAWNACVTTGKMPQLPKDLAHTRELLGYPEVSEDELRTLQENAQAQADAMVQAGQGGPPSGNGRSSSGGGAPASDTGKASDTTNRANMIVEKHGNEWWVLSEDGSRVLGKHDNPQDAYRQLAAIDHAKVRRHDMAADEKEQIAPMVEALLAIPIESVPIELRAEHEALLAAFGGGSRD